MAGITIKIIGVEQAVKRADAERTFRRPLRRMFRAAGKSLKANVVAIGRPVGRSLVRRLTVKVDRSPVPTYVRVTNRAAWVNVAEVGRRPGAKMPPMGALRGGFAAARAVSARGLPGHHVMQRATDRTRGQLPALTRQMTRDIEASWRGRR